MRILVVDDEPEVVAILLDWLSRQGHEATGLTVGRDMKWWVEHQKIDLVVTDMVLDDISGENLIGDAVTAGAAVVVISGQPSYIAEPRAFACGALACLQKPIQFNDLKAIIDAIDRPQSELS
jgi:DNA-binding NtrC family response regulator